MRKLPLFVLAAAAAIRIAGAPMTAHAAAFKAAGAGNGMNGHMTSCNGRTGELSGLLNGLGAGCGYNGNCGFGQGCTRNQSCTGNQSCASGQNCSGSQSGMSGQRNPFRMLR